MSEERPANPDGAPPHFIVVVPGYMGSQLRDRHTGEMVWIDLTSLPLNPLRWEEWIDRLFTSMTYPNDDLEPAGIVEDVLFLPPWVKQEQYSRLLEALEGFGYRVDPDRHPESELDVYTFPYDWRQDNRTSARQLGQAIERWRAFHPGAEVWIMGHSNGGIVARWYVEVEGGKEHTGRLILFGSPWDGAPKAMRILYSGLDTLFRRRLSLFEIPERSRDMLRSFPSAYQLIPVENPFLRDVDNNVVDPFANTAWLDNDSQIALLRDAGRFSQEIGNTLSVETLCFFGRKQPTQSDGVVRFEAGGRWVDIEWRANEAGDGTIPERSAVHADASAKLPFVVGHGDIYINEAVLEILQWELVDKYRRGTRAEVSTPDLQVTFLPDRDACAPGEPFTLSARVLGPADDAGHRNPLRGAVVRAMMTWEQPLPGSPPGGYPGSIPPIQLRPTGEPGGFQGQLTAPPREGYYRLTGTVSTPGQPPLTLSELFLVEEETL